MIIFMEVLIGTSSTHGGFWLHNWEIPRTKCWIFQLAMCDKRRYHPRFVVPCVWSTDFFIDFDDLFRPPVVPFCVFHIEDVVQMLGCASLARSPLFFIVQCSGFGSFGYETQLLLGGFKHVFPKIYIYIYIWDNPSHRLSYFSEGYVNHQPDWNVTCYRKLLVKRDRNVTQLSERRDSTLNVSWARATVCHTEKCREVWSVVMWLVVSTFFIFHIILPIDFHIFQYG